MNKFHYALLLLILISIAEMLDHPHIGSLIFIVGFGFLYLDQIIGAFRKFKAHFRLRKIKKIRRKRINPLDEAYAEFALKYNVMAMMPPPHERMAEIINKKVLLGRMQELKDNINSSEGEEKSKYIKEAVQILESQELHDILTKSPL